MATGDKFIQSMVELLDKLIENQSKNASLLSDIKFSLSELRDEHSSLLTSVREKLPEQISKDQTEHYNKLSSITSKIELTNKEISENIKVFEEDYNSIKIDINKNSKSLETYVLLLSEIKKIVEEKNAEKEDLKATLKEVKVFIDALKSKKAWVALIVAGVATLATMISAVAGGVDTINKVFSSSQTTQTSIASPANSSPTNQSNTAPHKP